jgi:wobble nucleotide-excising tRNase
MRRIIENYFKLLGKFGDDELIQNFPNGEEQEICRSLISWINDGSHSINDDLFIELQDRTVEMYKSVFRNIFIYTKHEGHYNMMMASTVESL